MAKTNKYQKGLLREQRKDAIKSWLDHAATDKDVDDLFVLIRPIECDMDSQGINTCSARSNEKCLECKHNSNIYQYWQIEDNYKPFKKEKAGVSKE